MPQSHVSSSASAFSLRKSTRVTGLSLKGKEAKLVELYKAFEALCLGADKTHASIEQQLHQAHDSECNTQTLYAMERELKIHLKPLADIYDEIRVIETPVNADTRKQIDRLFCDQESLLSKINDILPKSNPTAFSFTINERLDSASKVSSGKSSSKLSQKVQEAQIRATTARKQLEAQIELDDMEKEIEEKQRQLKQQRLRRLAEIEEEQAKELEEVMNQSETGRSDLYLTTMRKPKRNEVPATATQSEAAVNTPTADAVTRSLADALTLSRLPAPEPTVFSGDPLLYAEWNTTFTALIDSKTCTATDKMYYLRRYVAGRAKEAINGYFVLGTSDAYNKPRTVLKQRFGSEFAIADAFRDKLENWPKITGKGGDQLQRFADFLYQCVAAMESMPELSFLNDNRENRKLIQKLPDWLINRWARIIAYTKQDKGRYPTFTEFTEFIATEATIAAEPLTNFKQPTTTPNEKPKNVRAFNTSASNTQSKPQCLFCGEGSHHLTTECRKLAEKSPEEKTQFVYSKALCFGCMRRGHNSRSCKQKATCKKCEKSHPTALHANQPPAKGPPPATESAPKEKKEIVTIETANVSHAVSSITTENFSSGMIVPVYVSYKANPEKEIMVYALLDSQWDSTFTIESVPRQLNAPTEKTSLQLSTMTSKEKSISCQLVKDLIIRGVNSDIKIPLPPSYTRHHIPINKSHLPAPEKALAWPHLSHLADQISAPKGCDIALLIGYNCPQALVPREVVSGTGNEPFALKTDLGWSIIGRLDVSSNSFSRKISTIHESDPGIEKIVAEMNKDFLEPPSKLKAMSSEDHKFLQIMDEGIYQDDKGYFTMPLPFREKPGLNNSFHTALSRHKLLLRKFEKDKEYAAKYKEFMKDIIERGEAEVVPDGDLKRENAWYIPHFGVFHPKKPEKIRVVFDCAAKTDSRCLNDYLLQGPDMLNSLIGILLRFREKPVALMADVERMFHQFRIPLADRDYVRFLWEEDGKQKVYRMAVHLFGACLSPSCATYGLRAVSALATDQENAAKDYIQRDFYVDDGLASVATTEQAVELYRTSVQLCAKANIKLHKFISNDLAVMEAIPPEQRSKSVADLDLRHNSMPKERALGIGWKVKDDTFCFSNSHKEKPQTRRGILSTIASIYDPLGFLCPFILTGKWVLQEMCINHAQWDDPLGDELQS